MRLVAFYLFLLAAQGLLSAAFGTLPAPDLFLVAVLTLLGRTAPWQLVGIAYGVGLLQDVVGHGTLGMHAIALAGAALVATMVRGQLSGTGVLERMLITVAAQAGKWLVATALLIWLSGVPAAPDAFAAVAVTETVLTVAVALVVLPLGEALLDQSKVLQKELL